MDKKCSIDGCNNKVIARGYCRKHYDKLRRKGQITNPSESKCRVKNEIVYYDEYAEIILTDRYGNEKARTKIDLEDIKLFEDKRVTLINKTGYARIIYGGKEILIHRFIMNCPKGKVVDHINHDRLDNRKSNLRICTQADNMKNQKKSKKNTSGYKGVCWASREKRWIAYIKVDGKNITLGYFKNKEDAINARLKAEEKYYSEFKFIND